MFGRISREQRVALMLHCYAVGGGALLRLHYGGRIGDGVTCGLCAAGFRFPRQFPAYVIRHRSAGQVNYTKNRREVCYHY